MNKIHNWIKKTWSKQISLKYIIIAIGIVFGIVFFINLFFGHVGFTIKFYDNFIEFHDEHEWYWSYLLSIASFILAAVTAIFLGIQAYQTNKKFKDSFINILKIKFLDKNSNFIIRLENYNASYRLLISKSFEVINNHSRMIYDVNVSSKIFEKLISDFILEQDEPVIVLHPQDKIEHSRHISDAFSIVDDKIVFSNSSNIKYDSCFTNLTAKMLKSQSIEQRNIFKQKLHENIMRNHYNIFITYKDELNRKYKMELKYKLKVSDRSIGPGGVKFHFNTQLESYEVKIDGIPYINVNPSEEEKNK